MSLTAAAAVDHRLTPQYYVPATATSPYLAALLRRCRTVFDIKPTVAADLRSGTAEGLPATRGVIEHGAILTGPVIVEQGARVEVGARIIGPVLVCAGAVISAGATVRDHSVIGPRCRIGAGAEIARSVLVQGVFMKHVSFVGDSVLGVGVNVGAFCSTTAVRSDGGPVTEPAVTEVTVTLDGRRVPTGQSKFGAVVGDGVVLPAGTVLAPGTLIGPGTVIYPRHQLGGFLPTGARVR